MKNNGGMKLPGKQGGWVQAAGLIMSAIGTAGSMFGTARRDRAVQKTANKQADLTYSTRLEEMRRAQLADTKTLGEARAGINASGIHMSGSPETFYNSMQNEMQRQMNWSRKAAEKERIAIKSGAPGAGATGAAMLGQLASGVAQGIQVWQALKPATTTTPAATPAATKSINPPT